jgi:putative ABC transport system permease protein
MNGGFDAVLGARSSKLQLVLNAIFHLEASPANIGWNDYLEIKTNRSVAAAVPIAMGDNYRGFRVVGTLPDFFQVEYSSGHTHRVRPPGRLFDPTLREAVVGSFAARRLNLKLGDHFHPYHGLNFSEEHAHEEEYLVVGILEPSNTPADRVLWIPLEGVQRMGGHDVNRASELSAVLVKLRSPTAGSLLDQLYNKEGARLSWAWPIGATMASLLSRLGWLDQVLALVAYLVALVAMGSVLASIYNTMNERRRQIAILRALGAHRRTIFSSVILEAVTIAVIGTVASFGVFALIMTAVANIVRAQTGVVLEPNAPNLAWLFAPAGMIVLGALAGLVPAAKAYRVEVATELNG